MNERDDSEYYDFTFGMNDENGRLIQFVIPARTEEEARRIMRNILRDSSSKFWLNDCSPY